MCVADLNGYSSSSSDDDSDYEDDDVASSTSAVQPGTLASGYSSASLSLPSTMATGLDVSCGESKDKSGPSISGQESFQSTASSLSSQVELVKGKWEKNEPVLVNHEYTRTPGPTSPSLGSNLSAFDVFSLFFLDEVWEILVAETNRHAAKRVSPCNPWSENVTVVEMKAFIGLVTVMGTMKPTQFEIFWMVMFDKYATPGVANCMTRDRFLQLFRFFHLSNSSQAKVVGQPGYDGLLKVRKFLDLVLPMFESQYIPHQDLRVDEAMVLYKGVRPFKFYMKKNQSKLGVDILLLSDAKNGYVYRMQIYKGKSRDILHPDAVVGLGTKATLDLMNGLEVYHNDLYVDEYCSSPSLFLSLHNKGVNACGVVYPSRAYFPEEIIAKPCPHKVKFVDYRCNGPIISIAWVNRISLYFLSTFHTAEAAVNGCSETTSKKKVDKRQKDAEWCPPLLSKYMKHRDNKFKMQRFAYYNIGKRSQVWWKKVFFHVLECAMWNSYILYGFVNPQVKKKKYYQFKLDIARELSSHYLNGDIIEPSMQDRLDHENGHWPRGSCNERRCVACLKRQEMQGLSRESVPKGEIYCTYCNVHLCITEDRNCFMVYHTEEEYWH